MQDPERHLERVKPRLKTGKSQSFRDIPTLYLEDITRIYRIMEEARQESEIEKSIREAYAAIREARTAREQTDAKIQELNDNLRELQSELHDCSLDTNAQSLSKLKISRSIEPELPTIESDPLDVSMESDDFKFSTLDELSSLRRKCIQELKIHIPAPDLWVHIDFRSCYIRTDEDSPEAAAAFGEVIGVLQKRRNRFWNYINHPLGFFLLAVSIYGASAVAARVLGLSSWLAVLSGFFALFIVLVMDRVWRGRCVIVPKYKADAPSWWEQNKNAVLLTILGALLSALFLRWIVGAAS